MLFSKNHVWLDIDGDIGKIGITDYAQKKLGNILFLNVSDIDDEIEIGSTFGDVESIKSVSELFSPVTGKIIAINEDIIDEPDIINEDANGSWIVEVEISSISEDLLNDADYKEYIETL